ncbi:LPS export ABC transporter permease LptG [Shimia biformata]|uniref:LPS export ABC transporter permease LptG n=1 Tax=Shimia biformata TaxID=1294299 RepID=UPI0019512171|nr:LPS export ABC transporter permease LptG [Shimia biformata]
MTVYFYFARKFVWMFLGLALVFFVLMVLVDLVEHLRKYDVDVIGFSNILRLTFLNTPKGLYQILPLLTILSTITLFLGLARSSELVVVRAAGRSALMALMAPVAVALVIGALAITTFNPIVAATTERYQQVKDSFGSDGQNALSISREGVWLRQGSSNGQSVIHAGHTNADATTLFDVTIITYAPGGGPIRRVEADKATLLEGDGEWELINAKRWPLEVDVNPEELATVHDTLRVPSNLTRASIRDSFGNPNTISFWKLPAFISRLELAGFSARRHKVWYQMEMAQPLFLIAMVLIAAAFTMRPVRFGKTGQAVLAAVLLGFGLYFVRNFAQILGENGQIPVALAAWAPPVASVMLAMGLLLHMEDG